MTLSGRFGVSALHRAWIPALLAVGIGGCAGPETTSSSRASVTPRKQLASRPAPAASTPPTATPSDRSGGASTAVRPEVRDAVSAATLRERALASLLEAATAGSPEIRVNAMEALSTAPRRVEPILRAALVDPVPALRISAAMIIGNSKMESSASFVEPLLNDPVLMTRAAAAYALARCGRSVDLGPIAELLSQSEPRMRAQASYMLGQLGNRSALPMLEDAFRDSFPRASGSEIRLMELQIAQARVRLGDDDAIQAIRAGLFPARSEDLEATALAAQITGELRDRASIRELVMLTRMRDETGGQMPPEVRLAAAGSLGVMRIAQANPEDVAMELLNGRPDPVRAQAAFVLGQCGLDSSLAVLEPLLEDPSAQVRLAAATAITRITEQGSAVSGAVR